MLDGFCWDMNTRKIVDSNKEKGLNMACPRSSEFAWRDEVKNDNLEKPPVGLRPKKYADIERKLEILEAMIRYVRSSKKVPSEWIEEFIEIEGHNLKCKDCECDVDL